MSTRRQLKDKKELQLQYEKLRDRSDRFIAERYDSLGFYYHFHRNPELYCVLRGEVKVTIDNDVKILRDGDMAYICGLESHSYTIEDTADIAYFHIGTMYMEPFNKIYGNKVPERWLDDVKYNMKEIYPIVDKVVNDGDDMSELEKVAYANLILSNIINKYGVNERGSYFSPRRKDEITEIIQYIYDHSDQDLNLENLSKKFNYAPQVFRESSQNM